MAHFCLSLALLGISWVWTLLKSDPKTGLRACESVARRLGHDQQASTVQASAASAGL